MCIEMWWAVRIRELCCTKGMRNIVVDTSHHKVICQIFFQTKSLLPSVVSKDLTHSISMLFLVQCCQRTCQFSKHKVIKLTISYLKYTKVIIIIFALWIYLSTDIINACHILSKK